jgi:hypothetical protein
MNGLTVNRGVNLLKRGKENITIFQALSFWNGFEVIKEFAGEGYV